MPPLGVEVDQNTMVFLALKSKPVRYHSSMSEVYTFHKVGRASGDKQSDIISSVHTYHSPIIEFELCRDYIQNRIAL